MTDQPSESDVAWRLAIEVYNRPSWPTSMWDGTPAGVAHQLSSFADTLMALTNPLGDTAPYLLDCTIQLTSSATACAALLNQYGGHRIRSEDGARSLCQGLAPFAETADRVLNDIVDRYGFRSILTPSPAQAGSVLASHREFTHHPLLEGIQVIVYWNDGRNRTTASFH